MSADARYESPKDIRKLRCFFHRGTKAMTITVVAEISAAKGMMSTKEKSIASLPCRRAVRIADQ